MIKKVLAIILLTGFAAAGFLLVAQPAPAHALTVLGQPTSQTDCDNDRTDLFFGFLPKWYEYLPSTAYVYSPQTQSCEIQLGTGLSGEYWLIALAIIDILVRIGGLIAVIMVIYGGVRFITSQGEPEETKNARNTIINSLIGIVAVVVAIPVVRFIGVALTYGASSVDNLPTNTATTGNLQNIFNVVYALIGAVAVLMMVISGFRYIVSGGEAQEMAKARRSIIYIAVGVVVVLGATALVNAVVTKF